MSQKNFKLFVGVDEKRFSFTVIDTENEEDPKIVHTNQTPVTGVIENKITDDPIDHIIKVKPVDTNNLFLSIFILTIPLASCISTIILPVFSSVDK